MDFGRHDQMVNLYLFDMSQEEVDRFEGIDLDVINLPWEDA